jgi:hypothetical protein
VNNPGSFSEAEKANKAGVAKPKVKRNPASLKLCRMRQKWLFKK